MKKLPRIIYNDDSCTLGLVNPPHSPDQIDRALDYLADSQTDRICWNFFCSWLAQTWYSDRIENYFDLAEKTGGETASYLKYNVMHSLYQQKIDYLPILIEKCHNANKEFYASIRMNDCHLKSEPRGALAPDFWRNNQDKRLWGLQGGLSYYNAALDYSFPEVRDRIFDAIDEILSRYAVDGLELDFLRNEFAFNPDEAWEKRQIITDFIAKIRRRANFGNRQGHPVGVMIRLPWSLEQQRIGGFDLEEMLKQQSIDLVVAGTRSINSSMDATPIVVLCHQYQIPVYGDIQPDIAINHRPDTMLTTDQTVVPHCQFYPFSIQEIQQFSYGMADVFFSQGFDGIYLFNFPCWSNDCVADGTAPKPPEDLPIFKRIMHHVGSFATLKNETRRYYLWSKLPIYIEARRPEKYFQTLEVQTGSPIGPEEEITLLIRLFSAANPHAYHPEFCENIRDLVQLKINGVLVAPDDIVMEKQPAGRIPSGYTIGSHELWKIRFHGVKFAPPPVKISFFMPDYPGNDTPYIYVHDLQLIRTSPHNQN